MNNNQNKEITYRRSAEYRDRLFHGFELAVDLIRTECQYAPSKPKEGFIKALMPYGLPKVAVTALLSTLSDLGVVKRVGSKNGLKLVWLDGNIKPGMESFHTICQTSYMEYIHRNFSWCQRTKLSQYTDEEIMEEAIRRGLLKRVPND